MSNWLRNHIRCCASDSGIRSGRSAGDQRRPASPRAGVPLDRARPARPTVGASNSVPDADVGAERRAEPGDDPGRDQRVAAEVEEVVVDADPVDAEHLGEHLGDDLPRSASVGGAELAPRRPNSGVGQRLRGRACRSAVSGTSSSTTIAAGTM